MDSLNNIKILDFTQAMSGPIATMILSDLGAEVIKVEPLNGEQSRHWAPPYINKESAYYLSLNRNKKSIAIDLKNNDSKIIIKKLVENSDIIIENFKPGIPEKLNIDYNILKNYNDKIIYCSISGYGNNGPYKNYPAYDLTILARSGLMSITGEENGNPVRFGVPISDITTGLFSDISILSALHYRDLYNKGQYIDLSMLDVNVYLLLNQFMNYLATGKNPEKEGSKHPSIAPYEVFKTKDNYIAIAVGTEKLWNNLCKALNLNINNYGEFNSNENRVKNRDKLENILNDVFIKYNTDDIYNILIKYDIPCSPVNKISDIINDEQLKYRDMIKTLDAPYGKISLLNSPFKMSETPGRIRNYPPELGENTIDILKSLNFSEEQIKDFIKNNVVK